MHDFLKNRYLWGGLLLLFLVLSLGILAFNYVLMPAYTRQGEVVVLPDVRNLTYPEAERRLRALDLTPVRRVTPHVNPEIPPETVLEQNPPPGSAVKPGRRVYLLVSAEDIPRTVVPDVRNLSLREAQLRIAQAGLEIGEVLLDSIPAPFPDIVTGQEPEPGDTLPLGAEVTLWLSPGPGKRMVSVPDVVGLPVATADSLLLFGHHLRPLVIPTEDRGPAGVVLRQEPEPGVMLREGSEVRLYVILPPEGPPSGTPRREARE